MTIVNQMVGDAHPDEKPQLGSSPYYQLALQDLAPLYRERGFDIRNVLVDDPLDLLGDVAIALDRVAGERGHEMARPYSDVLDCAEIDGRRCLVASERWLAKAGIDVEKLSARTWADRTSNSGKAAERN